MLAMTVDRLSTIQRARRALLIFFIFMSVITLWGTLANIANPFPKDTRMLAGIVFEGAAITEKIHRLWLMQMVLSAALNLVVLYHFIRLMMLYAKGNIFTARSVAHIRQVGLTFAFGIAIWLAVLIGGWPEISAAEEQLFNIMPSFPGGSIIGACLFLFASRIMDEGRKLREEQDLVV
jgi:hypothetical protein